MVPFWSSEARRKSVKNFRPNSELRSDVYYCWSHQNIGLHDLSGSFHKRLGQFKLFRWPFVAKNSSVLCDSRSYQPLPLKLSPVWEVYGPTSLFELLLLAQEVYWAFHNSTKPFFAVSRIAFNAYVSPNLNFEKTHHCSLQNFWRWNSQERPCLNWYRQLSCSIFRLRRSHTQTWPVGKFRLMVIGVYWRWHGCLLHIRTFTCLVVNQVFRW